MVVCINGGIGSIDIVLRAVKSCTAVVLIRDSGGAALTIAHYLAKEEVLVDRARSGQSYIKPPKRVTDAEMPAYVDELRAKLAQIRRFNQQSKCIHSFAVEVLNSSNLELALLRAMVLDTDGRIAKRWVGEHERKSASEHGSVDGGEADGLDGYRKVLRLAIEWGEREIVQHLMLNAPAYAAAGATRSPVGSAPSSPASKGSRLNAVVRAATERLAGAPAAACAPAASAPALRVPPNEPNPWQRLLAQALELALVKRHVAIIHLLLERGARAEDVNLMRLWTDPASTKLYRFDIDHVSFQQEAPRERAHGASARSSGRWGGATEKVRRLNSIDSRAGERARARALDQWSTQPLGWAERERYLREVVPFIVRACALPPSIRMWQSAPHGAVGAAWGAKDLFVWAIFNPSARSRSSDVVHALWRYCDHPIREALIAAHMAAELAKLSRTEPQQYAARAEEYEDWCVQHRDVGRASRRRARQRRGSASRAAPRAGEIKASERSTPPCTAFHPRGGARARGGQGGWRA